MRLTPNMWEALTAASRQELRRTHTLTPGADPWPHPAASLHALVRRGLLTVGEIRNRHGLRVTVWAITDAGRQALEPVPILVRDRAVFLARSSAREDYTHNRMRACDELEVMFPAQRWIDESSDRRAEAQDRRAAARRLTASRRAA